jgi:hypothetical protein
MKEWRDRALRRRDKVLPRGAVLGRFAGAYSDLGTGKLLK